MSNKSLIHPYIQRGLMGFLFKDAMYPIAEKLKDEGFLNTKMLPWQDPTRLKIVKDIIKKYRANNDIKIVLVGHSMGGNAVTYEAKMLEGHGIPVELMIVIDAPMPIPVASNVKECINFYQFNDYRDPKLVTEGNTILTQYNYTGKEDGIGILKGDLDHISIAKNSFLYETLLKKMKAM